MNIKEYWQSRAVSRLVNTEVKANDLILKTASVYERALANIDREIKTVYASYSRNGNLDVSELKKTLTPAEKRIFLAKIKRQATKLGLKTEDLYDNRYLGRLDRLRALQEQMRLEIYSVAPELVSISGDTYENILKESYESSQSALKLGGASVSFATLDPRPIELILRSNFYGKNFSTSIWGNVDEFANELPTLLGAGIASGQSSEKTARQLQDRFGVAKREAFRLVRTESNYFNSQAELQSYIDDGIEEYEFYSFLDQRTSRICRDLDDEVFLVSQAQAGKNYPPMHPNCRSTTIARLPGDVEKPRGYGRLNDDFDTAFDRVQEAMGPRNSLASGVGEFGKLNNRLNYLSGNTILINKMAEQGFSMTADEQSMMAKRLYDNYTNPRRYRGVVSNLKSKIRKQLESLTGEVKGAEFDGDFKLSNDLLAKNTEDIKLLQADINRFNLYKQRGSLIGTAEKNVLENAIQGGLNQILSVEQINALTPESFKALQSVKRLDVGPTAGTVMENYQNKVVNGKF